MVFTSSGVETFLFIGDLSRNPEIKKTPTQISVKRFLDWPRRKEISVSSFNFFCPFTIT